ncbi:expressed protein [Phakopsora pachyrhizi]|uniref:Expressed protein n=1 Tax=Phakopsora pachyrhizi TaxID=170000 RepID=A0AAV0B4F5_PHAPC|nr:expressed protein [Phakopsora pachyrhizi]
MLRCMDFYFIAFTILLIFETLFESTASTTSGLIFLRRGGKKNVLYHYISSLHIFFSNQQLERSSFSGSDNDRTDITNDPSVTSASSESKTYIRLAGDHKDPLKIKRRSEPANRDYQQSLLRKKVHGYLKELLEGVQARHRNINEICATKVTQYNAQKVGWKILAELKAILALCLACASRIKGYATSPAPSGIPTPPGGYNNYERPTIGDICKLIYRLLCEFKECYKKVGALCSQYVIIKNICSQNLIQISEALSACLNVTGGKVNGAIRGVNISYGGHLNDQFFDPVGFGFDLLGSIFNGQLFYR